MKCKKCGTPAAFSGFYGECPCSTFDLLNRVTTEYQEYTYKPIVIIPDLQPTLRDIWAMAVFQKINIWTDVKYGITEAYNAADFAIEARNKNDKGGI